MSSGRLFRRKPDARAQRLGESEPSPLQACDDAKKRNELAPATTAMDSGPCVVSMLCKFGFHAKDVTACVIALVVRDQV